MYGGWHRILLHPTNRGFTAVCCKTSIDDKPTLTIIHSLSFTYPLHRFHLARGHMRDVQFLENRSSQSERIRKTSRSHDQIIAN